VSVSERGRVRDRLEKYLNLYERRKTSIGSEIPAWSKPIATQRPSLEETERVSSSGEMSSLSVEDSVGTYEIMDTVRVSLGENGYLYTSHNTSDSELSERWPKRSPKYLRCRSHRLSSASCMIDGPNAARRTRCLEICEEELTRRITPQSRPNSTSLLACATPVCLAEYITSFQACCTHSSLYIFDSCRSTLPALL
jgi:hypothetical protein